MDPDRLALLSGQITALEEERDPRRRALFVDGEFALTLDLETILRCGFHVGDPVDGPALVRAYQLDLAKGAWEAALALLAAAPRTVKEVGRRLGRSYPPEVVEEVLERLVAGGWLDDRAYAQAYIESHRDCGPRRLLADLIRKGVDREVAARAVEEAWGEADAVECARGVAAKRLARMGAVDRLTAQRRLAGYLARRGFSPDVIGRALAPLLRDLPAKEPGREDGSGRPLRTSSLRRRRPLGRTSGDEEGL